MNELINEYDRFLRRFGIYGLCTYIYLAFGVLFMFVRIIQGVQ